MQHVAITAPTFSVIVIVTVIVLAALLFTQSSGDPDTSEESHICSEDQYEWFGGVDVDYKSRLFAMLDDIALEPYMTYGPSTCIHYGKDCPGSFFTQVWIHGTCKTSLTLDDCVKCITAATETIKSVCKHSYGARLQLGDCFLRYEKYSFTEDSYT